MEGPIVIQAENVGKRYRLGQMGGATLAEDLSVWWAKLRGKPNPLIPIGQQDDGQRQGAEFWALREVGFELRKGEILGIIGRNGAGKSTLLKLLSRITLPTTGEIRMRGRVSSLLEVGTGFNPELSGRDNIYLNGAILGMKKAEIDRKLTDIIAFSGIEHHIDSPVKRYSSGMKVRLGFAVAAHLEPEILIIDEVLAVGDAEFQRKCLGKMKDVASSGRTILFVSHNMSAVHSLCTRVIWMHNGRVRMDGPTDEVVRAYLSTYSQFTEEHKWTLGTDAPGTDELHLTDVGIERSRPGEPITYADPFHVRIGFHNAAIDDGDVNVGIHVYNGEDILAFASSWREHLPEVPVVPRGLNTVRCAIPAELLNSGDYRIVVNFFRHGKLAFRVEETVAFEVHDTKREGTWFGRKKGVVRPRLHWQHASAT